MAESQVPWPMAVVMLQCPREPWNGDVARHELTATGHRVDDLLVVSAVPGTEASGSSSMHEVLEDQ